MKTQNFYWAGILFVALAACGGNSDDSVDSFEEAVAIGDDVETFPETRTEEVIAESSEPEVEDYQREENDEVVEERFVCNRKTVSVLDGNGSFPLFNTAADVIYPGSLLQGKTLSNATPSPIVVKRAGGTVSYDLNNGNLVSSFTVDEVTKSSISTAMNNIIASAGEVVPANFQLDIIQVESEQQLAVELGLDVKTFTTKVSADMSFSTERTFNRTLVRLTQSYYTMSFDLPTSLTEVFDEEATPDQLSTFIQPDNPAVFISSVTYGRIFYMLVESTSSRQEMQAALNVAYGAFRNKVEGELEVNAFQSLKNLKIKVIAYGGDATGTFQLAGETNVAALANQLALSTDVRAGLPLSYVARSVERPDQIVGTRIATEYDVVDCELQGILPPEGLKSLVDLFDDDADGGGIGAMVQVADSNLLVFSKKGDRYAWYNGNSGDVRTVFDINDESSPLGAIPLDDVGAALQLSDERIYLFDQRGLSAALLAYDKQAAANRTDGDAPTTPIGTYRIDASDGDEVFLVNSLFGDSGNFQFANRGFNAAVRVGATTHTIFAKPGDEYAFYNTPEGGSWSIPFDSTTWFNGVPNERGELFEQVGAAAFIEFGGNSGRWLLVNAAGNEITEWFSTPTPTFNGPWIIN